MRFIIFLIRKLKMFNNEVRHCSVNWVGIKYDSLHNIKTNNIYEQNFCGLVPSASTMESFLFFIFQVVVGTSEAKPQIDCITQVQEFTDVLNIKKLLNTLDKGLVSKRPMSDSDSVRI